MPIEKRAIYQFFVHVSWGTREVVVVVVVVVVEVEVVEVVVVVVVEVVLVCHLNLSSGQGGEREAGKRNEEGEVNNAEDPANHHQEVQRGEARR